MDIPFYSINYSLIILSKDLDLIDYPYYNSDNPHNIFVDQSIDKYTDHYFPPELKSLIPTNKNDSSYTKCPVSYVNEYRKYKWLRINSILSDEPYSLFSLKINPQDINQGELGSCYLLVALMGLSIYQERIENLFITKKVNEKGIYAVKILIQGEYHVISVDDYFPTKEGENGKLIPAFCSHKTNEIWAMIIEKCWAKLNDSCYLKIWMGTPNEALYAFSEAPCTQINHQRLIKRNESSKIWKKIVQGIDSNWIVCCNTEDITNADTLGLVSFHAYSIIKYYSYGKLKLLKIRNPIGDQEWQGDFSNYSKKLTSNMRQFILKQDNYEKDEKGTFTILFEDFIKYFTWTFMSRYNSLFIYRFSRFDMLQSKSKTINMLDNYSYSFCQFIIESKTVGTICLHQPQTRVMKKIYEDYIVPLGVVILAKLIIDSSSSDNYRYLHIKSEYLNAEKLYLNVDLTPGEYHLLFKSDWTYDNDYSLVISTYAFPKIEIYQLPYEKLKPYVIDHILLSLAYMSRKREMISKKEKDSFNSFSILNENKTGFGIIYYENNSSEGVLKAKLSLSKSEGIQLLYKREIVDLNYIQINIQPRTSDYFLIKMLKPSFDCIVTWVQGVYFDYPIKFIISTIFNSDHDLILYDSKRIEVHNLVHDSGYLIYIKNNNKEDYEGLIQFDYIEEIGLEIEGELVLKDEIFKFDIFGKGEHWINLKWKGKKQDYLPRLEEVRFKIKL